jgi:hypothetical protein
VRGDVEKLDVHMGILAKMCNKIDITTQNSNFIIATNAFM